jgi:hypothetical protein
MPALVLRSASAEQVPKSAIGLLSLYASWLTDVSLAAVAGTRVILVLKKQIESRRQRQGHGGNPFIFKEIFSVSPG